jgi:hypothetical protein
MPKYYVCDMPLISSHYVLRQLEQVPAVDAVAAMEAVAAHRGLDETEILHALDVAALVARDPDSAQRPAPQQPEPDPPLPGGIVMTADIPAPGYGVWEPVEGSYLELHWLERANSATAEIAIEYVAAKRGIDISAPLVAFAKDDSVMREFMAYNRVGLAEAYVTLVRDAGVQGQRLWDHYEDDPAYRHWRDYLDQQAAIDGFKLEHTWWLQTSFGEPLTLIARPDGKPYKLKLDLGHEKRVKAVERDYGRERLTAARKRADDVLARSSGACLPRC